MTMGLKHHGIDPQWSREHRVGMLTRTGLHDVPMVCQRGHMLWHPSTEGVMSCDMRVPTNYVIPQGNNFSAPTVVCGYSIRRLTDQEEAARLLGGPEAVTAIARCRK